MKKMKIAVTVTLAVFLTVGAAIASDQWLHVKIDGSEDGDESVRINLPLSFVISVLPAIEHEQLSEGKVEIEGMEVDDVDLKVMLEAVRDMPDAEFVSIRSGDETVRVAKDSGQLVVKVQDGELAGGEEILVKVPMEVVEALLQDTEGTGELNLVTGLEALSQFEGQDLVTVQDGSESIRVWIDRNSDMVE